MLRWGWFARPMVLLHLNQLHHFATRAGATGLPLKQEVGDGKKRVHITLRWFRSCGQLGVVLVHLYPGCANSEPQVRVCQPQNPGQKVPKQQKASLCYRNHSQIQVLMFRHVNTELVPFLLLCCCLMGDQWVAASMAWSFAGKLRPRKYYWYTYKQLGVAGLVLCEATNYAGGKTI